MVRIQFRLPTKFPKDKKELLQLGKGLMEEFCYVNDVPKPEIDVVPKDEWGFPSVCAYYRFNYIAICLECCGYPCGLETSMNWTWPGSTIDREPFGVICHELAHACDVHRGQVKHITTGKYWSEYSKAIQETTREPKLTNYCPNHAEWFAEIFRVFITNPNLLKLLRPKTYNLLIDDGWKPVVKRDWKEAMGTNVPDRVIKSNLVKIGKV